MRGFTFIELLITLLITAVLATLAWPGYTHFISRALRQDARLSLLRIQHLQENFFANHLVYASQLSAGGTPPGLALSRNSDGGHYQLRLQTSADGMRYMALARVLPNGRQANDRRCMQFAIDETGRRLSADAAGNWRGDDPYRCWG